jgi:hypothetical protein
MTSGDVHVYHTHDSVCVKFSESELKVYRRDEFLFDMQRLYRTAKQRLQKLTSKSTDEGRHSRAEMEQATQATIAAQYLYSHEELRQNILWTKPEKEGGPSTKLRNEAMKCTNVGDVFAFACEESRSDAIVDMLVQMYVAKADLHKPWFDIITYERRKLKKYTPKITHPDAKVTSAPYTSVLVQFFRFKPMVSLVRQDGNETTALVLPPKMLKTMEKMPRENHYKTADRFLHLHFHDSSSTTLEPFLLKIDDNSFTEVRLGPYKGVLLGHKLEWFDEETGCIKETLLTP